MTTWKSAVMDCEEIISSMRGHSVQKSNPTSQFA
jgi:hypothetical protein